MKRLKERKETPFGANPVYKKYARQTPKKKGATMLAWLTTRAVCALFFSKLESSSKPIINTNKTRPRLLSVSSHPNEAGLNKKLLKCGQHIPKTEGPRIIPAVISPITDGWPILEKKNPNNRAINTMIAICKNIRLRGWSKLLIIFLVMTVPRSSYARRWFWAFVAISG